MSASQRAARRGALRTLAFFESFFLIFFFGAVFFFVAGFFAAFFSATSGTSSSASAKGSSVRERRVFQAAAGAGGAVLAPWQDGRCHRQASGAEGNGRLAEQHTAAVAVGHSTLTGASRLRCHPFATRDFVRMPMVQNMYYEPPYRFRP